MEKQLIPQLRFSKYEGKWEKVIISKIADKITDGTHDTPKPVKEGVPFLTAIHVKDGKIDFDNCYYVSEEEHNKIYKRCNPEFGDLLMVNIGAGTATSAIVNVNYGFSLKNVALIKPNKTKIYPSFFAQVQRKNSDRLRHQISSGGAQPFLSLKAIGKLKLNIPKINEQQKIASFLTDVDDKITKLTKKKDLLEQYKKGIMQKIFNQELRFKDDDGNTFPKWESSILSNLTNRNICYGVVQPGIEDSNGVKFIRGGDILNGYITKKLRVISKKITDNYKRTYLKGGELVMSLVGYPGETAIVPSILAGANLARQVGLIDLKSEINSVFVHFYFSSGLGKRKLLNKVSGSAQQVINISDLKKIVIPLPNFQEQTKIANFLLDIDAKMEALNTQIENSKTFKKGLLQKMFV